MRACVRGCVCDWRARACVCVNSVGNRNKFVFFVVVVLFLADFPFRLLQPLAATSSVSIIIVVISSLSSSSFYQLGLVFRHEQAAPEHQGSLQTAALPRQEHEGDGEETH